VGAEEPSPRAGPAGARRERACTTAPRERCGQHADPKHLAQWWVPAASPHDHRVRFAPRPACGRFVMHVPTVANYQNLITPSIDRSSA